MAYNDATKKILGFSYQKIIAIEQCFNAKINTTVWLECFGDVSLDESSTEVKHHIVDHKITSNSPDVWKTINNLIVDKDQYSHFSEFILHTTSTVNTDSIFKDWNRHTPTKKLSLLKSHAPSEGVKIYQEKVTSLPPKEMKEILDKFEIKSNQPQISEKWEELKEHPYLAFVEDKLKDSALCFVVGLIEKCAIDESNRWAVEINSFKRDMIDSISPYTKGKLPFPVFDLEPIDESMMGFRFVKKLKDIELPDTKCEEAVSDYIRANKSQIEMLEMRPSLADDLMNYDANVQREMSDSKFESQLSITHSTETNYGLESQKLYMKCIRFPYEDITNVDGTQKYYRDGRIHNNVEDSDFAWLLKEEK